jgi:hypothetical protein
MSEAQKEKREEGAMDQAIACRHRNHPKKKPSGARCGFVFASILVTTGVLFLLQHLGHLGGYQAWEFWPLALIYLGISNEVGKVNVGSRIWGLLLIAGGSLGLVHTLDLAEVRWDLIWPMGLVVLGAVVVIGILAARRKKKELEASPTSGSASGAAVMSSRQDRWDDQEFEGGEIKAVMGELQMDLSDAKMKGDEARLRVKAVMGEVKLRIPREWKIQIEGSPTLGEVHDKTRAPLQADVERPLLVIECDVVMGALEITD